MAESLSFRSSFLDNNVSDWVRSNQSDATDLFLSNFNLTNTIFIESIPDVFPNNGSLNTTLEVTCSRSIPPGKLVSTVVGIQNVIGPPILVFGIVTNILTLLTLQQKGMDLSPYVHLSWLAIADMSGLALILIDLYNDPLDRRWMLFRIYVYYPLSNVAAMMGVWIMVLVTLERSVVIRSIKAHVRCTVSRARTQVLGVFLVSFALNGPRFFWFQVALINEPTSTTCPPKYHICSYLQNWSGSKILTWLYSALNTFLPLVLLITLNSFLIYNVHARRRRQPVLGIAEGADTVWSTEQTRFTVTLIAIVGLFILLVMPSAFADQNILLPLLGVTHTTEVVLVFQYVSNFLMWLNMSINFLLYTAINTRFKIAFKCMVWGWRRHMLYWLCCWRCRDPDKKYHFRNYHHHRHRHHHKHRNNHMKGVRQNFSCISNDSNKSSQPSGIKLNILIINKDNNNRVLTTKSRNGRGIQAIRAYFTGRGPTRSTSSEVSLRLQPSIRFNSTGTSTSSSQTPTESTEMCPMLSTVHSMPSIIKETDSLQFLSDYSPNTPQMALPTLNIELKECNSTKARAHQDLQVSSMQGEIETCEVESAGAIDSCKNNLANSKINVNFEDISDEGIHVVSTKTDAKRTCKDEETTLDIHL